jgi:hypothetical protein
MHKLKTQLSTKKNDTSISSTLKLQEDRKARVRKALHTYISDNNVSVITDAQVHQDGKNYAIDTFSDKVKALLESKIKQLPIFPIEEYIELVKEYRRDSLEIQEFIRNKSNLKFLSENEIKDIIKNEKLKWAKSLEQAEEFLTHILFKTEDANQVRVVVKRRYEVIDEENNRITIEKEILDPGLTPIRLYEDTLNKIHVKNNISEKPITYWDVFNKSSSVLYAKSVYNPQGPLYYANELKHFFINSYIEPEWKKEPNHFFLMQRHKKEPMTFNKLSPALKTFLSHLFPDEETRKEVLKWSAFSKTHNLQTYLTLIGYRGIGKGLFVEDLLGYYHGQFNLNKPKEILEKYDAKNSYSTLIYFDELQMTTLSQYNAMKLFTNDTLNYQEKNQAIFTTKNYANIVWSCNTKDTMSAMSRDDRRFKIVPVANKELNGIPIIDDSGKEIGKFTSDFIRKFKEDISIKQEFVLLMLAIMDYVNNTDESLDDINTVQDNESRDTIFEESRSIDFIEIIDVLRNIFDDYNPITNKFGRSPNNAEKEKLGSPYIDYIPLGKVETSKNPYYTYRVPYSVIRKVLLERSGKNKPMSARTFNRHLENMPPKILKGYSIGGQGRDIEIRLLDNIEVDGISKSAHDNFIEKYYNQLKVK